MVAGEFVEGARLATGQRPHRVCVCGGALSQHSEQVHELLRHPVRHSYPPTLGSSLSRPGRHEPRYAAYPAPTAPMIRPMFSGAKNFGIGTVPTTVPKKRSVCS
jgi:hypothetical protein